MKKFKFKVIESGRVFCPDELNKLKGGVCSPATAHVACSNHTDCGILGAYTSCIPSAVAGYETTCSDGSKYTSCASGNTYLSCSNNRDYTACPGSSSYGS